MRAAFTVILCLLLTPVAADENEAAPSETLTPEQAGDAALEAVNAGDQTALEALAGSSQPDPWLVVDDLCTRGEHDAAVLFAKAAPRKEVEALPAYIDSQRGRKPDDAALETLAAMNSAPTEWKQIVEMAQGLSGPLDSVARIRVAFGQGIALRYLRRWRESADVLEHVDRAARECGWLRLASQAFQEAGLSAYYDSDWPRTARLWTARIDLDRQRGVTTEIAPTLVNLGVVLKKLGEYEQARSHFEQALHVFRQSGSMAEAAATLNNIGTLQHVLGNYEDARSRFEESLEIKRVLDNRGGAAATLINLAGVLNDLGEYGRALSYCGEALDLAREVGDKIRIAYALDGMGGAREGLGDYAAALSHYERALAMFRALGSRSGIADSLVHIGNAREQLGDYDQTLAAYERALAIRLLLGDRSGIADMLNNLGVVQKNLGDYDGARDRFEEALEIRRALGEKAKRALTLNNIGVLHKHRGEYERALAYYDQALEIHRALGDKAGIARSVSNLGVVQKLLGNHEKALAHYARALAIRRELGDQVGIARTLGNIGNLQETLGQLVEARTTLERALAHLEQAPDQRALAHVAWSLAQVCLRQGHLADAKSWTRTGIKQVAGLTGGLAEGEGVGAREIFEGLFDTAYRAALYDGDVAELAEFLERGRASSLREALGSRAALESAVIPRVLAEALGQARHAEHAALRRYRSVAGSGKRKQIRAARKAWAEAQVEASRVLGRIERAAKHAAAVALSEPADLETIQSYLAPTDALVYYALTSEEGLALVVREDSADLVTLDASRTIRRAVDAMLSGDRHVDPRQVPALRRLLVEPLGLGDDVRRVLVSPMGRLGYAPFSLLFPDAVVAYVQSGTTYGLLLEEREKRGEKILGLGDPDYRTTVDEVALRIRAGNVTSLPPLPATRKEVETIADVRCLGTQATETALERALGGQDRWRAVHFACHGLIDPERPGLSALALAADEANGGFLTALEIFRMKIPTDLVVMSACDTGRGRIYRTEGIVGLTRAFMFAGAARVICSLWKVDDEATQALMIRFYELWHPKDGSQGLGAEVALKQAQAFVRDHPDHREWQHPYYWAAWVLWGSPQ